MSDSNINYYIKEFSVSVLDQMAGSHTCEICGNTIFMNNIYCIAADSKPVASGTEGEYHVHMCTKHVSEEDLTRMLDIWKDIFAQTISLHKYIVSAFGGT